jgi:hypothetical protein
MGAISVSALPQWDLDGRVMLDHRQEPPLLSESKKKKVMNLSLRRPQLITSPRSG